ncbi:alpha/beta hydrolase [Kribbella capetownensis]|uniref:Alpha/beta hydrolase n=1 Tax=Kribbella capetownensis TaxID=1572659 RepID=A0A4R0INV8_9ACTN|nr:alpha/beta hydrolase [Kribbella capetownensis]TCC34577.1 alpha/beta hydrolase [Kribbella capetownensis]
MSQEQRAAARSMMSKGELGRTADAERAAYDALFAERPLGDDVTLTPRSIAGVPALDVQVAGADGDGLILYLHGGGYVVGSARTGANLAAPLARRTGVPAVSLDYRRAPEDPFPAAVEDALAAYKELLAGGRPIALAGESAGGGLVLATILAARREGLPLPAAAVVFSPLVDLTLSGESMDTRGDFDPLFSRDHIAEYAAHYLAGHDARDELGSPLFADLTGLPPLLIQVGSAEVVLDDALRLATRAARYDVDVSLDVVAGAPHVFQYMVGVMDEADEALDRAAAFLGLRLPVGAVA